MDRTIRARGTGVTDLRDRSKTTRDERTIKRTIRRNRVNHIQILRVGVLSLMVRYPNLGVGRKLDLVRFVGI